MLPTIIESKIDRTSTCWLWTAAKDRHGYGVVRWDKKAMRAHRTVYFLLVGRTDLELDHLCRVRSCVNPAHLEPVQHAENVARGMSGKVQSAHWALPRNCPRGHSLSGPNLYTHYNQRLKRLNRQCRECKRTSKVRRRAAGAPG